MKRGLILADTKFEFGLPPSEKGAKRKLVLIDELLTPDSSRYWSAKEYSPGRPQASFDKQYLRDWLIKGDLRNKEGVMLPQEVVQETREKYEEARDRLMGPADSKVHGKKGLVVDETGLQTDQVADAVEDEARRHGKDGRSDDGSAEARVHGKKGLVVDGTGLQTDQVNDAVEDVARRM